LLKIENAIVKYRDQVLFEGLDFEVGKNEHWAIVGENGSGKSALLQVLAGRYFISSGKITRNYYEIFKKEHTISDPLFSHQNLISYVDVKHNFKNRSNMGDFFYQQRFNAGYADNAPTVEAFLNDKVCGKNPDGKWNLDNVYEIFKLEPLRQKHLIQLSNGEAKRLRIGAALLENPILLLIDNPMAGLDVHTRKLFEGIFVKIADSGICLVMVTSPFEIPKIITHVAALNKSRKLKTHKRQVFQTGLDRAGKVADKTLPDTNKLKSLMRHHEKIHFDVLVNMKNVRVSYGETVIFDNIRWTVRPGDRWALSGPNGSGKSTLLSLINGDHPQAYANEITLFDRKRGSGESIWDIKKKIGFMSPELFQYFPYHFTCLQVVESGFYDTIGLLRQSQGPNRDIAEQWMAVMGLTSIKDMRLYEVSTSRQRLCLLARAMVKNPYLLLLDEPCLGFDRNQQQAFKILIDEMAEISNLAIIYVTHRQETLPGCITKRLMLKGNESNRGNS